MCWLTRPAPHAAGQSFCPTAACARWSASRAASTSIQAPAGNASRGSPPDSIGTIRRSFESNADSAESVDAGCSPAQSACVSSSRVDGRERASAR